MVGKPSSWDPFLRVLKRDWRMSDKVIGKGTQALSLWRWFLSGMKERNPFKGFFKGRCLCHPGKWTATEGGIHYQRELAMLEIIFNNTNYVQSPTGWHPVYTTMWQQFVWSTTSLYANLLSVRSSRGEAPLTLDEVSQQLWQYRENL